ncbi:MAG TPA: DUF5947 family protein [Pyrinomonadaceae bacterium]|nr:DUF5947 family protein [Pyrinomonadaceae bacterium]
MNLENHDELEVRNSQSEIRNSETPFAVLRRFVRQRAPAERCEMCSLELAPDHEHLVDVATRQLTCACQACAILFSGKANVKYRRVPKRIRYLSNFQLTDAQWESLLIPISMAFFFHSSAAGKVVALYPSPAGATESLLDLEAWDEILRDNPVLGELEPDTEALLVNRVRGAAEYYLLPIDECYKLVGIIRTNWHGLSGGTQMWDAIGKFFAELKEKAVGTNADAKAYANISQ